MPHMQNALFRRVRLSSPGQTWRRLMEKRILVQTPHGKAHSGPDASRKSAFWPDRLTERRTLRSPDHADCTFPPHVIYRLRFSVTSRRPGGVGQPPRQAAGHYGKRPNWANALEQPPASLRGGLRQGPQISVRSLASRKGALCPTGGLRMLFSVTTRPQNASFREGVGAECAFS